jgi:hypothetical protein
MHQAVIRHVVARGEGVKAPLFTSAFYTSGVESSGEYTHDIVFYDVTIHDLGDDDATEENDYHGILPGEYSYNIWILNSTIYNMGGDAVQLGSNNYAGEQMPHHLYVGGNDFYHCYENAVDIKNAHHTIVSENRLHDFHIKQGYPYGKPVTLHQQGGDTPTYAWFLFNDIYDCAQGFQAQDFKNIFLIGNTFHDIHVESSTNDKTSCWYNSHAIMVRTQLSSATIVDNSFYDCDVFMAFPQTVEALDVHGNILAGKSDPDTYDICGEGIDDVAIFTRNLFSAFDSVRYLGIHDSLASLQEAGGCLDCLVADPAFVSAPTDLRITADSAARDQSTRHGAYDLFFDLYGLDIARDKSGVARPDSGGIWDIGAYEYDASTMTKSNFLLFLPAIFQGSHK